METFKLETSGFPLVSVIVITYNSSETVIETLESIKAQTYEEIELIITDDASKDGTVEICQTWIDGNKSRFVRVKLLTVTNNSGTAANCNRGGAIANGKWLKYIAGDDLLMPNCIEDNVAFVQQNHHVDVVFSNLQAFGSNASKTIDCFNRIIWTKPNKLNKRELHIIECYSNVFGAASSFISKKMYQELSGFDEKIPLIEDWPFYVKTTQNHQVVVMDKVTVKYRIRENSVSMSDGGKSALYKNNYKLCKWHNVKYMRKVSVLYGILGYFDYQLEFHYNVIWRFLGLTRYLNPYYYIRRKIINSLFPMYKK